MKIEISHLRDNDVTYFQHMKRAVGWSARLGAAGAALLIHSFFPFIFTHYASSSIFKINKEMVGASCKKNPSGV